MTTIRLTAKHTINTHGETYSLDAGEHSVPDDVAAYIVENIPGASLAEPSVREALPVETPAVRARRGNDSPE
jgi:hypothetical protein